MANDKEKGNNSKKIITTLNIILVKVSLLGTFIYFTFYIYSI